LRAAEESRLAIESVARAHENAANFVDEIQDGAH
jgi:hypothetical protein